MTVEIRELCSQKDAKQFVDVQFDIYKGNKYWVPPIKASEIKSLFAQTNPAFEFCDAKFWLAFKNGKCMGRIGALVNHLYNEKKNEKTGRFNRMEFFDDEEVAEALITIAEKWVKDQGMTSIRGPLGFTNLDTQGLLIEGFDYIPSVGSVYHMPYYHHYLEKFGYQKEIDWVEFRLTVEKEIPEKALKLNELVQQRYGYKVIHLSKSDEMMKWKDKVFGVFNQAFDELPFVVPLNEKMKNYYSEKYFKMINPRLVKLVIDSSDNLVGFIVGFPSLSEAMQKANGKMFPFGFIHLLNAMKKPRVIDLMLTGILPQAQGQGVPAIIITELQREIIKYGVRYVETTGIFETNQKAIQHWKSYDHIQHKRRRCFIKNF